MLLYHLGLLHGAGAEREVRGPGLNGAFYLNRALRIYGTYLPFLGAHLLIFGLLALSGGESPLAAFFASPLMVGEKLLLGLANLVGLGQDAFFLLRVEDGHLVWTGHFNAQDPAGAFQFAVIPAAWSLSLELVFYAIAPFIARRPAWQVGALAAFSLGLRAWGVRHGFVGDPFEARFFPFELLLFLLGILAYKAWAAGRERWDGPAGKALAIATFALILAWPWWSRGWPADEFFTPPRLFLPGTLAYTLPAIHDWSRSSRVDHTIGELSFPTYLGHTLVYGLLSGVPALRAQPGLLLAAAIAVTLGLAWLTLRTLDTNVEALRLRLARRAGARQKGDDIAPVFA